MKKINPVAAVLALILLVVLATVPDGIILPDAQNAYYIEEPVNIPLGIQPYGVGLALAAVAAFIFVCLWLRKRRTALSESLTYLVWAASLGFLISRLLYCLTCADFYFGVAPAVSVLHWWEGGMSMTGALAGMTLAALICWKGDTDGLEAAALGMPVFVMLARLAESQAQTGRGMDVEFEGLLTLTDEFGGVLNVWLLEALMAVLVLGFMLLWRAKYHSPKGMRLTAFFFILYGALQILMESLRADRHMIWGFVKAQQLYSFLLSGGCLVYFAWRCGRRWAALAAAAALAGGVFGLEKGLDRLDIGDEWLYLAFCVLILGYLWYACAIVRRDERRLKAAER